MRRVTMCPKNSLKLLQAIFLVWALQMECLQLVSSWRDTNASIIGCLERERRALLELKQGLVDDYGILSSWSQDGDSGCCKWWGVECSKEKGHVLKLDLYARDFDEPLRGEISASLVELDHLNYLDLSWNDFHKNPIPEFIGSLTTLRYLNLSHASFSGKIPYQFGKLSSLQTLYLEQNYLVGDIPWQLGNLSKLQQLSLYDNHLGGIIPCQLGNLSRLEALSLGSNDNLQIDIPSTESIQWISHLSSLTELQLDHVSNLRKYKNWLLMVGQLPNLRLLSLTNCSLSDMDLLSMHPSKLNFSNSLEELILYNNKFTSSIFPWLYNFNSSFTSIDLAKNLIEGTIPYDLGRKINSLHFLYLNNNQLTGTIPKTIANLSELYEFDVGGNFLEGEITNLVHFDNLPKLRSLTLSQNSFVLKFNNNWIPQFQLEDFRAQSCLLGPSFPKWLQTQKDLSFLDVSNAGISDSATMTSFLCSAKESLNLLNMSSNHFKGKLPDCWNHLRSLRIIDLSNNEFSGNIPTSMGSLLLVRHLILRNNHFTGNFPSLKNCTNLIMLDVGRNELSGHIPSWIGSSIPQLQVLTLRNNNFYGSLPLHLCHLTKIHVLDLSLNNLFGRIPRCLQNFTAMTKKPRLVEAIDQFYVHYKDGLVFENYDFYPTVNWKGKELSFKDNKRLLKLIDLSGNELLGEIPKEIGNLFELVSLDLSSNNLSGQIPWELGKLNALDFLDLSRNHLSGTIPSSISEIDRLAVLNLSNNNLSGKIPSGTQLQSFDASVYDGNPYLCGSPLERLCPDEKESNDPLMMEKHEEDYDDTYFTQGFYISMGLGFATGFWAIFASLLLFHSWRHAYFTFLNNFYERIVVITIINIARCNRLLER